MINAYPHDFWKLSVAPMMDWTTPQCRILHRQFSSDALLYSEMVTTGAIIFGDEARHLNHFDDGPCALQLGGSDFEALAKSCAIAQKYGYQEINLNVGCPSDRVQNNRIGACLMDSPRLVAKCLKAMQKESDVPVTVKHRLGIDEQDERGVLEFVDIVANESDCRWFTVHARKAWLQGLSPKDNRVVPPLNYDLVYEVKQHFPELMIAINGNITSVDQSRDHLEHLDGVMLGRAAYQSPMIIAESEKLFGKTPKELDDILFAITNILELALSRGERLQDYTRHLLGLFQGINGARQFRRILSEEARLPNAGIEVWQKALDSVEKS